MSGADDSRAHDEIRFASGLSDAQRAEAERIFAGLRATRRERHERAAEVAAAGAERRSFVTGLR